VCAFGLGLMVMVIVLLMVIIVPEEIGQVDWLRQRQHQSFHRLRAFYWPKLPQTESFPSTKSFPWKTLLHPKLGSLKRGSLKQALKQAIKQAVKQDLKQALKCQRAFKRTFSNSVYNTGITAKTTGSKDRY